MIGKKKERRSMNPSSYDTKLHEYCVIYEWNVDSFLLCFFSFFLKTSQFHDKHNEIFNVHHK